jgi:hypothetical protein
MSLYSADLLRSGFYFTGGRNIMVVYKKQDCSKHCYFVGLFMVSDFSLSIKIISGKRFCKRQRNSGSL